MCTHTVCNYIFLDLRRKQYCIAWVRCDTCGEAFPLNGRIFYTTYAHFGFWFRSFSLYDRVDNKHDFAM